MSGRIEHWVSIKRNSTAANPYRVQSCSDALCSQFCVALTGMFVFASAFCCRVGGRFEWLKEVPFDYTAVCLCRHVPSWQNACIRAPHMYCCARRLPSSSSVGSGLKCCHLSLDVTNTRGRKRSTRPTVLDSCFSFCAAPGIRHAEHKSLPPTGGNFRGPRSLIVFDPLRRPDDVGPMKVDPTLVPEWLKGTRRKRKDDEPALL